MDGQLTKSPKKSAVLQTPFVMRYAEVLSPCILDVANQESSRRLCDGSLGGSSKNI